MQQHYFLKPLMLLALMVFSFTSYSQAVDDDFEDGDLTGWTEGTASHWVNSTTSPITGTRSLKHNVSGSSGNSYIYHDISAINLSNATTWQFNLKNGAWDPSSSNKFWFYLTANETNLNGSGVDGYAVGVNLTGTDDLIKIWKVTDGAADGVVVASDVDWGSSNTIGIRVTRSSSGLWELLVDSDGGFDALVSKGTATNTDYTDKSYAGLSFTYSSTRAGLLWLDDVLIQSATGATIGFDSSSSSGNEGSSVNIPVTFANRIDDVTISVTASGGTASTPTNYTGLTSSLVFTADGSQNVSVTLPEDAGDTNETLEITIAITNGTATLGTSVHTLTINDNDIPDIVISEIMYNTPTPGSDDEWIELYNDGGSTIDIDGWTLDYGSNSFTFTSTTEIPAGEYITIALGSNNTAGDYKFNQDFPFEPDFNTLGYSTFLALVSTTSGSDTNKLTNSSATITLKNGSNVTIDTVTYDDGDQGNGHDGNGKTFEIVDVNSDNVSTASNWRASSNNGGSPGASITSTWSGASSALWAEGGNWDNGIPNTTTINAVIPDVTTQPNATSAISANFISIASGASLRTSSTVTATLTYNLNIPDTNWHLISSPIVGEQYGVAWNTINSLDLDGTVNASNQSLATYVNTTDADGDWTYFDDNDADATFGLGTGYSLLRTSAGDISFTGTMRTEDTSIAITANDIGGGGENRWTLIGNPYPSYMSISDFLGLAANATALTDTHESVYVWNGTAYTALTTGHLYPGQAFFVSSNIASTSVAINEDMMSDQTGITFYRNATTDPSIELTLSDGQSTKMTEIKYSDGKTTGLDPRFDIGTFTGTSNSFHVYSHLISNSQGVDFMRQTLPNSNHENLIVPIGVNADNGTEITFTANALNIPNGLNVFIEDRDLGMYTQLDVANAAYTVTLGSDLNGIGRFYLHTNTQSALSTTSFDLSTVSIYKTSNTNLRIVGLQNGNASLSIFDILGKQVLQTSFEATSLHDITLPNVKTGVYIIRLSTDNGMLNKKIILNN